MEKKWKKIPGFSNYEVSETGEIRSIDRVKKLKNGRVFHLKGKDRKLRNHPNTGFAMTDLISDKGNRSTMYAHKAVAMAFIKNPSTRKKKVVIHLDGNVKNNHIDNLQWASYGEAIRYGFKIGKRDNSDVWKKRVAKYGPMGGTKPMGRPDPLTDQQKEELTRLRLEEKKKFKDLAKKFNCSISYAYQTVKKLNEKKTAKV